MSHCCARCCPADGPRALKGLNGLNGLNGKTGPAGTVATAAVSLFQFTRAPNSLPTNQLSSFGPGAVSWTVTLATSPQWTGAVYVAAMHGVYQFAFSGAASANVGNQFFSVTFQINGVAVGPAYEYGLQSAGSFLVFNQQIVLTLNANDQVDFLVQSAPPFTAPGGAINVGQMLLSGYQIATL